MQKLRATCGNVELIAFMKEKLKLPQNKFIYIFRDIKNQNQYLVWLPLTWTTTSAWCGMEEYNLKTVASGMFCHSFWQ